MKFYVSWVPTVVGALSFKKLGETDRTKIGFYERDSNSLLICSYAKRNTSDAIYRKLPFLDFMAAENSNHQFFLVATGDADVTRDSKKEGRISSIRGTVFIQQASKTPWTDGGKSAKQFELSSARKMKERVVAFQSGAFATSSLFTSIRSEVMRQCFIAVNFNLRRSGYIELWTDANCEAFEVDLNQSNAAQSVAAMQAFAFVRDVAHTHKHHAERTDAIVGLHDVQRAGSWHYTVRDGLRRKLVLLHCDKSYRAQADAIGVAAYLESFNEIFDEDGAEVFPLGRPGSNALVKSLSAGKDKLQIAQNTFFQIAAYLFGVGALARFFYDQQSWAEEVKLSLYGLLIVSFIVASLFVYNKHRNPFKLKLIYALPEKAFWLFLWVILPVTFFASVYIAALQFGWL